MTMEGGGSGEGQGARYREVRQDYACDMNVCISI
jgi:hypothetical protein